MTRDKLCLLVQLHIKESTDVTDNLPSSPAPSRVKSLANRRSIRKTEQTLRVRTGQMVELQLTVELQRGLHFTEGAPSACQLLVYGPYQLETFPSTIF